MASHVTNKATTVILISGSRLFDLPDYYLDAVIALRDKKLEQKLEYDNRRAESMRERRKKAKH